MSLKHSYFTNIDIIRFIAAIGVVFAHGFDPLKVYFLSEHSLLKAKHFHYVDRFFDNLGIGVEIFWIKHKSCGFVKIMKKVSRF